MNGSSSGRGRKLRYIISPAQDGMTIRTFLTERLSFSSHQISRLKYQREGICVGGQKAYVNHILREGELLEIGLTEQVIRRETEGGRTAKIWLAPSRSLDRCPLQVLYEDEDLLIVDKPAGIVCHPSPGHYNDTLASQAAAYLGGVGTAMDIRVTGRLDRETSGIVTFARNTETAGMIQRQRQSGILQKTYLALAWGYFTDAEGVIDMPLRREYPGSHRMIAAEDGKAARTFYRVLAATPGGDAAQDMNSSRPYEPDIKQDRSCAENLTLLACRIEHGRTHQIRVHLASIGHPIVGDPLYGRDSAAEASGHAASEQRFEKRGLTDDQPPMGLHAWKLSLIQPFTGEKIEVEAPAPGWAAMADRENCGGDEENRTIREEQPLSGCGMLQRRWFGNDGRYI